jgi:hypothetical protein
VETKSATVRTTPRPVGSGGTEGSAVTELRRMVGRQQARRNPHEDLVWQPRFAYTLAIVIFVALTVITLPLWLVLYRISSNTAAGGPKVSDLVGLCMMLLGGFLTAAAAWTIMIEMRGRVRMVDTLARTSEREVQANPALPVLDEPALADAGLANQPMLAMDMLSDDEATIAFSASTAAGAGTSGPGGPIDHPRGHGGPSPIGTEAVGTSSVAATLEASSHLLSAFSSVLRAFGQLPAQVAMLAVALSLFVGATVLSLH